MIETFKTISGIGSIEFDKTVNAALQDGWQIVGGVGCYQVSFPDSSGGVAKMLQYFIGATKHIQSEGETTVW